MWGPYMVVRDRILIREEITSRLKLSSLPYCPFDISHKIIVDKMSLSTSLSSFLRIWPQGQFDPLLDGAEIGELVVAWFAQWCTKEKLDIMTSYK